MVDRQPSIKRGKMSDLIDRILKTHKADQQIKCPYCEKIQSNDDYQYPITYWGDDGVVEWECDNDDCGKKFFVDELVDRTYLVGKKLDSTGYVIEET